VQGLADERIPASIAERYAAEAGTASTYLPLKGDHLILLKEADQVQAAITDWLIQQEGRPVK
jgi:hypothetical protein